MTSETIPALLAARVADAGAVEAVVGDGRRIDYAGLDAASAALAATLVAGGVNKGHRTALLMANSVDWAIAACAVMRIGAVLVPLSTLLRPRELEQQLAIAGVRHLIAVPQHRGRDYRADLAAIDRAALPSFGDVWWWDELASAVAKTPDLSMVEALGARVVPADDLVVLFTSGSRGAPKGIIHTHGGAFRAVRSGLEVRCIRKGTRLYIPMPFFWLGGFGGGLLSALIAGATLLTEAVPEPTQTLRLLQDEKATLFRGWPDQAVALSRHPDFAKADLSALRPGSLEAVLPPQMRSPPGARAGLLGMTESFGPYSGYALDRDMPKDKWGGVGRPFEGMSVRIVDIDTGAVLSPGEPGSIQIAGSHVMRGICGREREAVFTRDLWYDTGDLGRLDADGFLFFAGRRDDMFKVKGATVYPVEVEEALMDIPGVRRAFAGAITVNGQPAVGAAVLAQEGASLAVAELAAAAKERLSAFKLPSRWTILASLEDVPTTATGKVNKAGLKALLERGQAA